MKYKALLLTLISLSFIGSKSETNSDKYSQTPSYLDSSKNQDQFLEGIKMI